MSDETNTPQPRAIEQVEIAQNAHVPVKQINPTDWAAWGMETPDNDGWIPYTEVQDEA